MGPMHLVSAPPSSIGSGSESDWGREYEDEDTWYEFSSVYQTGPETHLFPAKDTGLTLRYCFNITNEAYIHTIILIVIGSFLFIEFIICMYVD